MTIQRSSTARRGKAPPRPAPAPARAPAPAPGVATRLLSALNSLHLARGCLDDLAAVDATEPVGMQAFDDHAGSIRRHVLEVLQNLRAAELAIGVGS